MCLPKNVQGSTIQQIAVLVGNLLCLNFGLTFGITPAHVRLYQSAETPLNRSIDEDEAAWLSGNLFLGAAFGAILFGLLSPKIGPKSVLLLSGLLQICGWFCIHFGYDIIHIHSSRLFAGVGAGAAFVVLPIFISEISEEANSAALTATIDVWRTLGICAGFVMGSHLRYDYVNIVGACISFVFSMSFPFVQESPFYFRGKGNVPSMEKSLRWYRGIRDIDDRTKPEFVRELSAFSGKLQDHIVTSTASRSFIWRMSICCVVLAIGAQFTGVFVILNYAEDAILSDVKVFSVETNVLILAGVQFVGANIAGWIGEKISRKLLLFITALICGLSLISLSFYLYFGESAPTGNPWTIEPFYAPWLTLGLLSLHMLSANIGVYPLATAIMGDILPPKLRNTLASIFMGISWLLVFLLIQCFNVFIPHVGLIGCYWVFGGVCILVAIFAIALLPSASETSLEMDFAVKGEVPKINTISNGHITTTLGII